MLSHKARVVRRTLALTTLGVVVFGVAVTSGKPQTAIAESVISQIGSTINGEASGDDFGQSVALSADGLVFAVGAPYNGANRGHVRVYEYDGVDGDGDGIDQWTQRGSDIDGEEDADVTGWSVALNSNGTRVAIGATFADGGASQSGLVRVYSWSGSSWQQLGADIPGENNLDLFGYSVSMSADGAVLAVGAPQYGTNLGRVRVYEFDSGTDSWVQRGGNIDGTADLSLNGWSVALNASGTRLASGSRRGDAISAGSSDNRGHVRVFDWNGSSWTQVGATIYGEAAGDQSGSSVALNSNGTVLAIGAPDNGPSSTYPGHVRVYAYDGIDGDADGIDKWTQRGSDIDGDGTRDESGSSVSLSSEGNRVAIGAPGHGVVDFVGSPGRVRIYDWTGSAWSQVAVDIEGAEVTDVLGESVSLSADGSRVGIGATGDSAGKALVYSISTTSSTSSTTERSYSSSSPTSTPGIFLTIHGREGMTAVGTQIRFGAFAIQNRSPYVVSIREGNDLSTQRVLSSGRTNSGGHLDDSITLPNLPAGSHTVVLSAYQQSGAKLILGNSITVDSTGTITSVTSEKLQPTIR